jgi:hypothetical protein
VGLALTGTAVTVAGCSASGSHHGQPTGGSSTSTGSATRWWSNNAAAIGSTIAIDAPDQAAAKLHPSRVDYCGMLEQAVHQGQSLISNVGASDPALVATMTAFFTELKKVAPAEVAADWQVTGTAMLALVQARGKAPTSAPVDGTAIRAAADRIAVDAKRSCHIDLAAAAGS